MAVFGDSSLESVPSVVGVPKSGTTWLQLMLSLVRKRTCLRHGGDHILCTTIADKSKHNLFKTHNDNLYVGVFRNPCKILTSNYYFKAKKPLASVKNHIVLELPRVVSMQNRQVEANPQTPILFYASLCKNATASLMGMYESLNIRVDRDDVTSAVSDSAFDVMRNMEMKGEMRLWVDKHRFHNQPSSLRILVNSSESRGVMTRAGCSAQREDSDDLMKHCAYVVKRHAHPKIKEGILPYK